MRHLVVYIVVLTSLTLLRPMFAVGQELTGAAFMRDFRLVADDANDGFIKLKGPETQRAPVYGIYYEANARILQAGQSCIYYNDEVYLKYSKLTVPREYSFQQTFEGSTPAGRFVADSAEALLDAYARRYRLVKKVLKPEKRRKNEAPGPVETEYTTPDRQKICVLSRSASGSTGLVVYSPRNNASVGNYLGCMVLYNPDSSPMKYWLVYYVYGPDLPDPGALNGKIMASLQGTTSYKYDRYEWKPGASFKQMVLFLDSYKVRYDGREINADGTARR